MHLGAELPRVAGPALRAIEMQAREVEHAGPEAMASMAEIPDPRIGAIAVMRFPEGKGRETTARRMRRERTSPAKRPRRFPRGTIQSRPAVGASFL